MSACVHHSCMCAFLQSFVSIRVCVHAFTILSVSNSVKLLSSSVSYLLAVIVGGWCPRAGLSWWSPQPAGQRRWGGRRPAPDDPLRDTGSPPPPRAAPVLVHTHATASPAWTHTRPRKHVFSDRVVLSKRETHLRTHKHTQTRASGEWALNQT